MHSVLLFSGLLGSLLTFCISLRKEFCLGEEPNKLGEEPNKLYCFRSNPNMFMYI